MSNGTLGMVEAKALARKNLAEAAGQKFEAIGLDGNPTGAIGTILPELSARGKLQAEMTCTHPGCTQTHVREISDWHQSNKCRDHKKSKKGGGSSTSSTGGNLNLTRPMKIEESDTPEIRAMKEEFNQNLAALQAAEKQTREAAKAKEAEERKAKAEAERKAREEALVAKKAADMKARLDAINRLAKEKGVPVSAKTLAEADQANAEEPELDDEELDAANE